MFIGPDFSSLCCFMTDGPCPLLRNSIYYFFDHLVSHLRVYIHNGYVKREVFLKQLHIYSYSICIAWLFRPGFNSSNLRLLTEAMTKASSVVTGAKEFLPGQCTSRVGWEPSGNACQYPPTVESCEGLVTWLMPFSQIPSFMWGNSKYNLM